MDAPNDPERRAVSPLSAESTRRSSVSVTTEGDFATSRKQPDVNHTRPFNEDHEPDPDRSFAKHEKTKETPTWRIWHLEALSSLLALACLVAMAVILAIYQRKPLPEWPDLISINTLIAVFTAVFRASLILPIAEGLGQLKWTWFNKPRSLMDVKLFDDASRGPWGSLLLLFKQFRRPDRAYLAAFGALITVAALAIDPFSQAIIEHRTCPQEVQAGPASPRIRDPPTTPRTNNYTGLLPGAKYKADFARSALDLSMSAALYRGLVDPQSSAALLDWYCPTGNCTFGNMETSGAWGYFSTLEMCHSCVDITPDVVNRTTEDETRFTLGTELEVNNQTAMSVKTTNGSRDADEPFFSLDLLTLTYEDYCTTRGCQSNFIEAMRPLAVRCTLDPCVRTYTAVVMNGVYSEVSRKEEPMYLEKEDFDPDLDWSQVAFSLVLNATVEDGKIRGCLPVQPGDERADGKVLVPARPDRKINRPKTWENSAEWELWPVECVFAMDMTPYYGISAVLHELLSQNLTATELIGEVPPLSGPVWLQTMYREGDASVSTMEAAMGGLAASISATMRNRPRYVSPWNENYAVYEGRAVMGTALTTETCVIVHWGWIAYPAALLVLQLVFLALVMGRRWRRDGGRWAADWKSSPLALLFHGLDENLREGSGEVSSVKSMNRAARRIKAQLMEDPGGQGDWNFR